MSDILAAQVGISPRQEQEELVAYYQAQENYSISNIIQLLSSDSLPNTDSLIKWLEFGRNPFNKIALVQCYMDKGDFSTAQKLVDEISLLHGMANMTEYLQNYVTLYKQGKTWFEMKTNGVLKDAMIKIASNTTEYGSAYAGAALTLVFGTPGYNYIERGGGGSGARLTNNVQQNNASASIDNSIGINAYPNPFKNELNVNYTFQDVELSAVFQLIEAGTGRIVQQKTIVEPSGYLKFNTDNIAEGLYVLCIRQDKKPTIYYKVVNIR